MPVRKIPVSVRDYVKSLAEIKSIIDWIRVHVMDAQSRKYFYKMSAFSFCVIFCQLLWPLALGKIFTSLTERIFVIAHGQQYAGTIFAGPSSSAFYSLVLSIIFGTICLFVQKVLERKMAKAREWIMSIHWSNMDRRMTELFFEKSPGQHIHNTELAVSGIDKGRWNLISMQTLVFFDAVPAINQIIISLSLLLFLSATAGSFMFFAVCCYVGYSLYLNFNVMKTCTPIDRAFRRLNRKRYERMEKAIRVIISSQSEREVTEMTEEFNHLMTRDRNFWLWFIGQSTWRSFVNISLFIGVLIYGVYLVWNGHWGIGMLYPLTSWGKGVIDNIWHLADIEQKINWNLPSIKAMIKALSIEPDVLDVSSPVKLQPNRPERIILENIFHSYRPEKRIMEDSDEDPDDPDPKEEEVPHTLKDVSFTIEPGEKVALLGPSGAGKTTLMRLLLRFMDPDVGSISVGGYNLRTISRNSWMQGIGYIAQQPEVFDGTVRENLTYRLSSTQRAKITDEYLWQLMRRLEIDFGKRLDKGLDTRVGKHGLKLSGGQAQRLMIGSAVIGNPWFMIIDEATSSLDSTTERKVQKGLSEILSGDTSALIVAHRLSTVRNLCSKFIILRPAGNVLDGESQVEAVASSFEELYKISPTFRELANDQGVVLFDHATA